MKHLELVVVILLITSCVPTQVHESQMISVTATLCTTTDAPITTPMVSSTPQETSTSRIDSIPRIIVYTDQHEYQQESTVTVMVRNETDHPIWYSSGQRFWNLERLDSNGHWTEVNFSFPVPDPRTGTDMCSYIVYEQSEPAELGAQNAIQAKWHLSNICEWPLEPIGIPTSVHQPVAPGTYRIVFTYGLSVSHESISEQKEYSDPIMIR